MEELYEFVISWSPLSPKARCVVGFIFNSVLQVLQKHVFFVMLIYACTFADAPLCVIFLRTSLSWMAQTLKEDPSWIIQTSLCCFLPRISGFIFSLANTVFSWSKLTVKSVFSEITNKLPKCDPQMAKLKQTVDSLMNEAWFVSESWIRIMCPVQLCIFNYHRQPIIVSLHQDIKKICAAKEIIYCKKMFCIHIRVIF